MAAGALAADGLPAPPSSRRLSRFSLQYSSTLLSRSSSRFCRLDAGNFTSMLSTSATSVVSKAVARPPVTLLSDCLRTLMSFAWSSVPENPLTAPPMPITVPMNPRMGMAQMNTLGMV